MRMPWPLGALEVWLGLAALVLVVLALAMALGGAAGGYTGAVQGFIRLLLVVVALQVLALFGLLAVISSQHRTLRRAARSAALLASRRASDADQGQVLTAAANLAAAAAAVNDLVTYQRELAAAMTALAGQSGIEVVLPVPVPGERA